MLAISARTSNTTFSIARRVVQLHQLAPLLHQAQLQHFRLGLGVHRIRLSEAGDCLLHSLTARDTLLVS